MQKSSAKRAGLLTGILLAAAALAACTPPPSIDETRQLLADDPALPSMRTDTHRGYPERVQIAEWEVTDKATGFLPPPGARCPGDIAVERTWQSVEPDRAGDHQLAAQAVCGNRSAERAAEVAAARIHQTAGEDYPNFDYDRPFVPTSWKAERMAAADAQLACAIGDPDGVCGMWMYRGRYARFVTEIIYFDNGGGITAEAFLSFVDSAEVELAPAAGQS